MPDSPTSTAFPLSRLGLQRADGRSLSDESDSSSSCSSSSSGSSTRPSLRLIEAHTRPAHRYRPGVFSQAQDRRPPRNVERAETALIGCLICLSKLGWSGPQVERERQRELRHAQSRERIQLALREAEVRHAPSYARHGIPGIRSTQCERANDPVVKVLETVALRNAFPASSRLAQELGVLGKALADTRVARDIALVGCIALVLTLCEVLFLPLDRDGAAEPDLIASLDGGRMALDPRAHAPVIKQVAVIRQTLCEVVLEPNTLPPARQLPFCTACRILDHALIARRTYYEVFELDLSYLPPDETREWEALPLIDICTTLGLRASDIKTANMAQCDLTTCPSWLAHFPALETLVLRHNARLESLPLALLARAGAMSIRCRGTRLSPLSRSRHGAEVLPHAVVKAIARLITDEAGLDEEVYSSLPSHLQSMISRYIISTSGRRRPRLLFMSEPNAVKS